MASDLHAVRRRVEHEIGDARDQCLGDEDLGAGKAGLTRRLEFIDEWFPGMGVGTHGLKIPCCCCMCMAETGARMLCVMGRETASGRNREVVDHRAHTEHAPDIVVCRGIVFDNEAKTRSDDGIEESQAPCDVIDGVAHLHLGGTRTRE